MARSRNYPMLQKSPSGLCEIEICNYRIGAPVLLNRCCAFQPDLESIFLAEMLKILLQHNLPLAEINRTIISSLPKAGRLGAHFQRTAVPQGLSFGSSG